jgi:hypothetical protein
LSLPILSDDHRPLSRASAKKPAATARYPICNALQHSHQLINASIGGNNELLGFVSGDVQVLVFRRRSILLAVPILALSMQACTTTGADGQKRTSTAMDRAIAGCVGSVAIGAIGGAILGAALGGNRGLGQGAVVGAAIGAGRCAILVEMAAAEDRAQLREAELAAISAGQTSTRSITTTKGRTATVLTRVSKAPLPAPLKVKVDRPVAAATSPGAPAQQTAPAAGVSVQPPNERTEIASDPDGTIRVDENVAAAQPATERPQVQTMSFVEERQNFTECRFSEMIIDIEGQSADGGKQKWCKAVDGAWQPVSS